MFFFFNDTATTEIYTLSLHDALPILRSFPSSHLSGGSRGKGIRVSGFWRGRYVPACCCQFWILLRSEEHTSELQSLAYLVCRLLLEKKKDAHEYALATEDKHHNRRGL